MLRKLKPLLKRVKEFDAAMRAFSAKQLLQCKNDSWLADGEQERTEDEFGAMLRIRSVVAECDRRIAVWYDDGDLFWGHAIVVWANEDGEPEQADICG